MSLRFEMAMSEYHECRSEYQLHLDASYEAAAEACNDALLNDRGIRAQVDPRSLFMGNSTRAYAYASPELVAWWETNPRVTFADFEASWPYPESEAA